YLDWKTRYLDHPILAPFTRRLIWRFNLNGNQNAAMPLRDQLLTANNTPLTPADFAAAKVSLWHPSADTVENIRAWRAFLDQHQITQPFKQAHREIYLLTDAERQTENYSNRFAAHIIRQHIF